MEVCASLTFCKSVDYSAREKKCYLGEHAGTPKIDAPGFMSATSMGCSGACKNYPKPAAPYKEPDCPRYHMKQWLIDGKAYQSECSQFTLDDSLVIELGPAATPEECTKMCDKNTACQHSWLFTGTKHCRGSKGTTSEKSATTPSTTMIWMYPFSG